MYCLVISFPVNITAKDPDLTPEIQAELEADGLFPLKKVKVIQANELSQVC